jgi:RNA polymerase sigma-70 factor, ECF subfamily
VSTAVVPHFRSSLRKRRGAEEVERGDCWDLVASAQGGDSAAFGMLYERYVDVVFRFVLYRTVDRPTAEDLTSETFCRALKRLDSAHYQGRDVGAWFITIARNLILDHVKSSRYRLEVPAGDAVDTGESAWPSQTNMRSVGFSKQMRRQVFAIGLTEDTDPGEEATRVTYLDFARTELDRARRRLTAGQQEVLHLRFDLELTVAQTAAAMGEGYNEGAVKALQHRAVRRLGELLPETIR